MGALSGAHRLTSDYAGVKQLLTKALDGQSPRFHRAPSRVNLIGDHTDYNDGLVLPVATPPDCISAWSANHSKTVRVMSLNFPDPPCEIPAQGGIDPALLPVRWWRYAAAVSLEVTRAVGLPLPGVDIAVLATGPIGAGLSSSASFEVAIALALLDAAGQSLPALELAASCRDAEIRASGVPCGIMDQAACLLAREGNALLGDCRDGVWTPIPLHPDLEFIVVHSGKGRELAASAYAQRRSECERIAEALGLSSLRDATQEMVAAEPRARHVVSENARVERAAGALERGDLEMIGDLMTESHRSLRDDFEVSTPELDSLVSRLLHIGAAGARLTGGGFGGCVVAACPRERGDSLIAGLLSEMPGRFAARVHPGPAAGRLS